MLDRQPATRRRLWLFVPFALLVALAVIWTGLWFYAARRRRPRLPAGARAKRSPAASTNAAGRPIGGFPFRIEVRCTEPSAETAQQGHAGGAAGRRPRDARAGLSADAADRRIQRPDDDRRAGAAAGLCRELDARPIERARHAARAGARLAGVRQSRPCSGRDADARVFNAKRIELHGRMAEGSASDNPVIDVGLRATARHRARAASDRRRAARTPTSPPPCAGSPISRRSRGRCGSGNCRQRGGRIEIVNARVQQGEVIAVSAGTLGLTERGNLDGQLHDDGGRPRSTCSSRSTSRRIMSKGRVGATIDKLDRLLPGLGSIARKNAGPEHPGRARRDREAHHARRQARGQRAAALRRRPRHARAVSGRPHAAAVLILLGAALSTHSRASGNPEFSLQCCRSGSPACAGTSGETAPFDVAKRPTKIARQRLPVR